MSREPSGHGLHVLVCLALPQCCPAAARHASKLCWRPAEIRSQQQCNGVALRCERQGTLLALSGIQPSGQHSVANALPSAVSYSWLAAAKRRVSVQS